MFYESGKLQVFASKEKPTRKVMVEFNQSQHYNALVNEHWCPKDVYTEKECVRTIVVLCETDEEALKTAAYHFFLTGSNFKVKNVM